MPDLADGATAEIKGSAATPYIIKNVGGVYSCSCPAWRNQSLPPERRTCKHLRRYRGDEAEAARLGAAEALPLLPQKPEGADAEGPPLLLAESWHPDHDIAGWWMSEKLDGVRAYWDGKQFISRQGNLYHAPEWFTQGLPNIPLDGELWIARKAFQRTISVVRRQDKSVHWQEVRFLVFDAPAMQSPFEHRLAYLETELTRLQCPYAQAHPHQRCRDTAHLLEELARIEALGGEGLMMRQPGSLYVAARSTTLLKVKTFHDAEAIVIGYEAGKGKHQGRLGALLVKLADGTKFAVGTGFTDKERENPPGIGSVITFRYQELSDAGVPRFPSYVGIRADGTVPSAIPSQPSVGASLVAKKKVAAKPAKKAAAKPAKKVAPKKATKPKVKVATKVVKAKPKPKPKAKPKVSPVVAAPVVETPVVETPPVIVEPTPVAAVMDPAPVVTPPTTGTGKRHFEFVDDSSSKFWEIALNGSDVTTWWGRIGTGGQTKTKNFGTPEKAQKEYDKLLEEKTSKGYIEK